MRCWLWERRRYHEITRLAQQLEVTLELRRRHRWLMWEIDGEVSGRNAGRFLVEFARHC
jgi:hypothetical protein